MAGSHLEHGMDPCLDRPNPDPVSVCLWKSGVCNHRLFPAGRYKSASIPARMGPIRIIRRVDAGSAAYLDIDMFSYLRLGSFFQQDKVNINPAKRLERFLFSTRANDLIGSSNPFPLCIPRTGNVDIAYANRSLAMGCPARYDKPFVSVFCIDLMIFMDNTLR